MFGFCLFTQAQEDLKLARSADMSADILKLKEEIKQTEIKMEQMSAEREMLLDRLKVRPQLLLMLTFVVLYRHRLV